MKKIPLIVGNWKMNKTISEAVEFITKLAPQVTEFDVKIYLSVPFTVIAEASKVAEKTKIEIGAQNMNDAKKGAFTGEIAALMLKEVGAEFVLLGHSERRTLFAENDKFINRKVIRAIKDDLQPILCVGETEEQRAKDQTSKILERQLIESLKDVSVEDANNIIIAYEPVWAIGTGLNATPKMVQEAHKFIRKVLSDLFGKTVSSKMNILYGGSVKSDNIAALMVEKDIDGALVGGASLEINSFLEILKNCRG